jgi:exodeoxyribonuclease-5
MRSLLGFGQDPCPVGGDRLVCLRNNHSEGLLNGTIWHVKDVEYEPGEDRVNLQIYNENDFSLEVEAHMHYFRGTEADLPYWEISEAECFDFGYALTTHKAQGSQWDSVFIFNESGVFRGNEHRWLYTAVTRAAKKVVICTNFQ